MQTSIVQSRVCASAAVRPRVAQRTRQAVVVRAEAENGATATAEPPAAPVPAAAAAEKKVG